MKLRIAVILLVVVVSLGACDRENDPVSDPPPVIYSPAPTVDSFIETVLSTEGSFSDMSFGKVIESSTGNQVVPVNPSDPVDAAILDAISSALDSALKEMSRDDSLSNKERRINEVSSYFEEALRRSINATPGISCDFPKNASGKTQRSGYPDLRIVHDETNTVAYLDPKLVESSSLNSSLRTFYFTPKVETNKVLEDAHHLLVGIEHDGNTGNWKFLKWHLVDLTDFKVRLKAEFQANNKDLYQDHLIIKEGVNEEAAAAAAPN